MHISRATKEDLPAVRALMNQYGNKMLVEEYHLNRRDIALQARDNDGKLAAFVWGGLMANNQVMYIDKVACDPQYIGKGLINQLYKELFKLALKRGVREGFGIIRQDQYHDKACVNALKMAFGADRHSYTHVSGSASHILKELESLEVQ